MTGGTGHDSGSLTRRPETADATGGDGTTVLSSRLRSLLAGVAVGLGVVMAIEQLELTPSFPLTRKLMETQDVPVLLAVCALFIGWAAWGVPAVCSRWAQAITRDMGTPGIAAFILLAGIIVAAGTHLFAFDFALSRDEAMAVFDAKIIASGRLIGPVAAEWRAFVSALQPEFRLPVPGDVAWVSSYLPGNAAIRAALGFALSSAMINAVLVVAALAALLGVARKLWPEQREAWIVAVVLAASSSQVLFMGMTPYAMSAHLALNLIWLWLFLRNTPFSHLGAVGVGFLATGLHQFVFHPLFVAPFIAQMLIERRWRVGAFYSVSYAAIGIFWILYWQLLLAAHGIAPEAAGAMGASYLGSRVEALLANFSVFGIETMAQNLLRFWAWQNPLLLVLLVPGFAVAWRVGGIAASLAGGIVLTLAAMFILLPYQDLGWGYRYVHGLIGNAALLGAYGWLSVTGAALPGENRAARGLMLTATAASMLILLPIHANQMHRTIAPYARAHAEITRSKADVVIVEALAIYYGNDLVRNDPDLANRPLTFEISYLNEALVRDLCSRFRIALFKGTDAARFGIAGSDAANHSDYVRLRELAAFIDSAQCRDLYRTR